MALSVHGSPIDCDTEVGDITELEQVPSLIEALITNINSKVKQKMDTLDGVISASDLTMDGSPIFSELGKNVSEAYENYTKNSADKLFSAIDTTKAREEEELNELEKKIQEKIEELKRAITDEENRIAAEIEAHSHHDEDDEQEEKKDENKNDNDHDDYEPNYDHLNELKAEKEKYEKRLIEVQDAKIHMHSAYKNASITYDSKTRSIVYVAPTEKPAHKEFIMDEEGVKIGYVLTGYDKDGNYQVTRMEKGEDGKYYHVTYTYDPEDTGANGLQKKVIEYYDTNEMSFVTKTITYNADGTKSVTITNKDSNGTLVTYEASYDKDNQKVGQTKVTTIPTEGSPVESYTDDNPDISEGDFERKDSKEIETINAPSEKTDSNPEEKSEEESGKESGDDKDKTPENPDKSSEEQGNPGEKDETPDNKPLEHETQHQLGEEGEKLHHTIDGQPITTVHISSVDELVDWAEKLLKEYGIKRNDLQNVIDLARKHPGRDIAIQIKDFANTANGVANGVANTFKVMVDGYNTIITAPSGLYKLVENEKQTTNNLPTTTTYTIVDGNKELNVKK